MISLDDALASLPPLAADLTPEEARDLKKLEAAVDAQIFCSFTGPPMRFAFQQDISPALGAALERLYTFGGWMAVYSAGPPCALALAPSLKSAAVLPMAQRGGAPVAVRTTGKRLLVRMPTRGRPRQALEVLAQYRARAGVPFDLEVVIDEDDATMTSAEVLQRLLALGAVVTVGAHKSKVEAVNGGRLTEWDVLLLASDDMVPVAAGFGRRVFEAVEEHFPHLDGAIYFDDGYQHEKCCTLPILGRRLYQQFGHVYSPWYQSLWCDAEQTAVLRRMGRLVYVPEVIIEHRHWVTGAAKDALYERNDALFERDRQTYDRRAAHNFHEPEALLSICICSLPGRRVQLERLLEHLWAQILEPNENLDSIFGGDHRRMVEVVVDSRPPPVSIGEKRQSLLERARGRFVAFVDDDDWVSEDYVLRILYAHTMNKTADCMALVGMMTTAGAVPERFENSLRHAEWRQRPDGTHERSITHLSPVRREIALQAGFPSQNHAEDFEYSRRLGPLLQREASTGDKPLYYYFYWPTKERGT